MARPKVVNLHNRRPNNLQRALSGAQAEGKFIDVDPILDDIRGMITESGMTAGQVCNSVYQASDHKVNPHYQTIERWMDGKTKRPSNFLIDWVAFALGYHRPFVKVQKPSRR